MRPTFFDSIQILSPDSHPGLVPGFVPPVPLPEQTARAQDDWSLKESIRRQFFALLGGRRQWTNPQSKIDGASLQRILVFRYDAVGDFYVTTPLVRWLKAALPHTAIDVVTCTRNDALLHNDPFVRNTYMIEPGHDISTSWLRVLKLRYTNNYDLVVAPIWTRISKAAILAAGAAPKAKRITFLHPGREHTYGLVFDYQVMHYAWREHRVQLTRRVGQETIRPVTEPPASALEPYLTLAAEDWKSVRDYLQQSQLGFGGFGPNVITASADLDIQPFEGYPFAVVNISSYMPDRQWHDDNCIVYCREIIEEFPDLHLLITGAPNADKNAEAICRAVDSPRCQNFSFTLSKFTCLTAAAKFVVTPDSAPVHIAAAAGIPVVGIYSRFRDACEWYPWGVPWTMVLSPSEDTIHDIGPKVIVDATKRLLSEYAVLS